MMCRDHILLYVHGGRVNLCAHKEERAINTSWNSSVSIDRVMGPKELRWIIVHA